MATTANSAQQKAELNVIIKHNYSPLIITNESIQQELVKAKETIIWLEKELQEKPVNLLADTPLEKMIKIDLHNLEKGLETSKIREQIVKANWNNYSIWHIKLSHVMC